MVENELIREIWERLEGLMNKYPEPIKGLNLVYQYEITGQDNGKFQLHLANNSALVIEGESTSTDCKLMLTDTDFKKMVSGKLNGTAAFMTGRLKVQGSLGLAIKLEAILKEYSL